MPEERGIIGVWNTSKAALVAARGLQALQHGGRDEFNVVSSDGAQLHLHRATGVARFGGSLPGQHAIGCNGHLFHTRFEFGEMALALSGTVGNEQMIRRQLVRRGSLFQTTAPAEVIGHLIATSLKDAEVDRLIDALRQLMGSYSLVALTTEILIAVCSPSVSQPLVLGKNSGGWVIMTSETVLNAQSLLSVVGAEFTRGMEPGEVISLNNEGIRSTLYVPRSAPSDNTFLEADPPSLPTQGVGLHFEINEHGVIGFAPPEALDQYGNNVARLRWLHPNLRTISGDLVTSLSSGNVPHAQLRARAAAYQTVVDQDLELIDFSRLYVEGIRLANAARAIAQQVADGDLPPLGASAQEELQTLLQLHGSFMLSTAEGIEVLALEERYQRTPDEERTYRVIAVDFASSLQKQPHIIDQDAASMVLGAAEQISEGVNSARSGVIATGAIRNVAITLTAGATVAAFPILGGVALGPGGAIAGGLAGFLASESLKKSKPFAAALLPITDKLDRLADTELDFIRRAAQELKKQITFVVDIEPKLRRLADFCEELNWLNKSLDWIRRHTERSQMHKS
jgi:hypothetical protein